MKRKASSRRFVPAVFFSSTQKSREILELQKQLHVMQQKIRSIEDTQRSIQAASVNPHATDSEQSKSMGEDSKKVRAFEDEVSQPSTSRKSNGKRKRRRDASDEDPLDRRAHKVAYIHVGEGGERDLEDHLRGSARVNIQILSSERLPDIDASDMIHGLDSSGTRRDYVDDEHRCNVGCPVGCQGHLRPNEIVIYESIRYEGKLFGRKRMKGRFVTGSSEDDLTVSLDMTEFKRIGGRSARRRRDEPRRDRDYPEPPRRRVLGHEGGRPHLHRHHDREHRQEREAPTVVPPTPQQLGVRSGLPQKLSLILDSPPVSREAAEGNTWNSNDKSFNIVLKEDDPLVMRRHPIAQSTDCIRGKVGYSSGLHMWEVTWPVRQRGTHAVMGVATSEAPLHAVGYQSLVGNSDQSWGWDLGRLKVFHNNVGVQPGNYYPSTVSHHHQWTVPDTFTMLLDMDQGSLGYCVGDQWLGWAVTGIKSRAPLYPVASTVWGHCEVKLRYLQGLESGVLSLQDLARGVVRETLVSTSESCVRDKEELERKIDTLPLPKPMKNFVKFY